MNPLLLPQPTTLSESLAEEYGWSAVRRDRANVPTAQTARPLPASITYMLPNTEVVIRVRERAKQILPAPTFNHAMRVYLYAYVIVSTHFPEWLLGSNRELRFLETLALTCFFHDVASTEVSKKSSFMSFQWGGAFLTWKELELLGLSCRIQAESICEAIIRLHVPGELGHTSRIGQLLELATEMDNKGKHTHLVHPNVVKEIEKTFPRGGWKTCRAGILDTEVEAKPWCLCSSDERLVIVGALLKIAEAKR
jgi:cyanamide hydratase